LTTEFQSGALIAATEEYDEEEVAEPFFVKLVDENLQEVEGGFNGLTARFLDQSEPTRGDARLFQFPDGDAGVFIERTGEIYKLYEVELDESSE